MVLPIKYVLGMSNPVSFETGETRSAIVTDEALSETSGYAFDIVVYTATFLDSTGEKLPAAFVVSLDRGAINLVSNQALDSAVYSQDTGLLTLSWEVPTALGSGMIVVDWETQII